MLYDTPTPILTDALTTEGTRIIQELLPDRPLAVSVHRSPLRFGFEVLVCAPGFDRVSRISPPLFSLDPSELGAYLSNWLEQFLLAVAVEYEEYEALPRSVEAL